MLWVKCTIAMTMIYVISIYAASSLGCFLGKRDAKCAKRAVPCASAGRD